MKWWWVNHKQTRQLEVSGGYLWAPKENKNNSRNQTYENLSYVSPGDIILSYASGKIGAIGIAVDVAKDSPKPSEFGDKGEYWSSFGSLVDVNFSELVSPFSPKENIHIIKPLLPRKYSPIQENGNGNQKCYLAEISEDLGHQILKLLGEEGQIILAQLQKDLDYEIDARSAELLIRADEKISETEKKQLVLARRGQGIFRAKVLQFEASCRVTGVSEKVHLKASHIKPWRLSTNTERLDGHNGLMLSPHVDHLFDRGFISFSDTGALLLSPGLSTSILPAWGVTEKINVGVFGQQQRTYLRFHRDHIFKR